MEQATPKKRVLTEEQRDRKNKQARDKRKSQEQRDRKNKQARDKRKSERAKGILPIKRKRLLTEEQRDRKNKQARASKLFFINSLNTNESFTYF